MHFLQCVEDFDELRSSARKIDDGINYLEKKLANVTNLGLSVNPEQTKRTAENVLKEYEDEIDEMKSNVESCLSLQKSVLQDCIGDNEQVSAFVHRIQTELAEIELQLQSEGNYQPYEVMNISENSEDLDVNRSDTKNNDRIPCDEGSFEESQNMIQNTETPERRKSQSTALSRSVTNVIHSLNTSMEQFMSPLSNRRDTSKFYKNSTFCENDTNKSISEICNITNNSVALLEKKLNHTDDVIKTPVDPGVSVVTMQLLGKSNVKTKVYKEGSIRHLSKSFAKENSYY